MSDFLQNIYVYLWAALAVFMLGISIKYKGSTRAMGFVLTLFFVFMTVWYGLRTFGGFAMFDGALGITFKVILGVFLAGLVIIYLVSRHIGKRSDNDKD